jgi:predicted nucleic acid-binding protein
MPLRSVPAAVVCDDGTQRVVASSTPGRRDRAILASVSLVLVHGERLVTRNAKHFAGIPELVVDTY